MWTYPWFWAIPLAAAIESLAYVVATGKAYGGTPWFAPVGMVAFTFLFGPSGYRISVDEGRLQVTGLGFMRLHEAMYEVFWRQATLPSDEPAEVIRRPQRGVWRWFNWPMLVPWKSGRKHFAFGTPDIVEVRRANRKPTTLGTRRSEALIAALGRTPDDPNTAHMQTP